MHPRFRISLMIAFRASVLAALVYLIWRNVDLDTLGRLLGTLRAEFVVPAVGFAVLVPLALAFRLGRVAGVSGSRLVRCLFETYFFNNFFVAQLGGDAYKIYTLSRMGHSRRATAASVVADRLIGVTAATSLALACVVIGYSYFTDRRIHAAVGIYLAVIAAAYLLIFWEGLGWLRWFRRLPVVGPFVDKLDQTRVYAKQAVTRTFWPGILLTVVSYSCLVCVNLCAMLALGIRFDLVASLLYVPVIGVAVVTLPISFNGLGVRESLFILFFAMAGYTNEEALGMALVNLLAILVVSAVGGLLLLSEKGTAVQTAAAQPDADGPAAAGGDESGTSGVPTFTGTRIGD